jgi:predicted amidophosphoribosyltransferase
VERVLVVAGVGVFLFVVGFRIREAWSKRQTERCRYCQSVIDRTAVLCPRCARTAPFA